MSPLRALRESLVQVPGLKEMSTQAGFARLIHRSESLVRAVESGRVPMSSRFARELSARFGVSSDWLEKKEVTEVEMPTIQLDMKNGQWGGRDTSSSAIADISDEVGIERLLKLGKWLKPDPKWRFRRMMILTLIDSMHDLFNACSDEELETNLRELREWTYSRLTKMVEMERAHEAQYSEAAESDDGKQPSN